MALEGACGQYGSSWPAWYESHIGGGSQNANMNLHKSTVYTNSHKGWGLSPGWRPRRCRLGLKNVLQRELALHSWWGKVRAHLIGALEPTEECMG